MSLYYELLSYNNKDFKVIFSVDRRVKQIKIKEHPRFGIIIVLPSIKHRQASLEFAYNNIEFLNSYITKHNEKRKAFKLLGSEIKLNSKYIESKRKYFEYEIQNDVIEVLHNYKGARQLDIFKLVLFQEANKMIVPLAWEYAKVNGFNSLEKVKISYNKYCWGWCKANVVSFNMGCMMIDPEMIGYLVYHELCHLKFPNHSMDFWKLLANFVPDFEYLDKKLNLYDLSMLKK